MKKEITINEFADDLIARINKGKTIDCCKEELLLLAQIAKERIGDQKITVNWKEEESK